MNFVPLTADNRTVVFTHSLKSSSAWRRRPSRWPAFRRANISSFYCTPWNVLVITFCVATRWVSWFRYWYDIGLAIHRSRVRVLAGRRCVVALGSYTYLLSVCLCDQAVYFISLLDRGRLRFAAGKIITGLAFTWACVTDLVMTTFGFMDEHPAYVREGAWHVLSFNFTD